MRWGGPALTVIDKTAAHSYISEIICQWVNHTHGSTGA